MKYRNDSATALLNPIDRIECRIHYVELPPGNNARKITRHAHECCEIYVNVSGDVSFAVEDAIYPALRSIITASTTQMPCTSTTASYSGRRIIMTFSAFFITVISEKEILSCFRRKKRRRLSACAGLWSRGEKRRRSHKCSIFSALSTCSTAG